MKTAKHKAPTAATSEAATSPAPGKRTPRNAQAAQIEEQVPARRASKAAQPTPNGKIADLVKLISAKKGASMEQMAKATGWQAHSVRGAISGTLKKRLGLTITSERINGVRVYRLGK
jgi:hypothetical protein